MGLAGECEQLTARLLHVFGLVQQVALERGRLVAADDECARLAGRHIEGRCLGKNEGDVVDFVAPDGEKVYEVLEVRYE